MADFLDYLILFSTVFVAGGSALLAWTLTCLTLAADKSYWLNAVWLAVPVIWALCATIGGWGLK